MFAHEETVAMISFTPRLSSLLLFFLGLLRPTTAWHGNEMGGRGRWRQRTDIKRQAQLDPATIVRCGHPPLCRASQGCGRSDSSGLLAHPWHPSAAGSTDKGPFPLMTCVTADGYLGQGEGECTQRHRSAVALGVGKKGVLFIFQLLHRSIPSTNSPRQETAMKYTDHAQQRFLWEPTQPHAHMGEDSRWVDVNVSQCFS